MTNTEAIEYLGKKISIPRLMSNTLEDCIEQNNYCLAIKMGIEAIENRISTVEELEKIKEKIDIECDSVDSALDVILDRISELKGE